MHRSYLYPHNPTFGALSQGRARFFCAKAGVALLFQHKLCWARELRSNTRQLGGVFSCTDCPVRTRHVSATPYPGGAFFAEPQRGFRRLRTAGTSRRSGAGQKDGHQGFHPFESRFLLGEHGEICRAETRQGTTIPLIFRRGGPMCPPISLLSRSSCIRTATHIGYSTQARHNRVAQLVYLVAMDDTYEYYTLYCRAG